MHIGMKNIQILLLAGLAASLAQGCSGSKAKSSSDSSATTTDAAKTTTVQLADTSSKMMADTTFASKAAVSGMAEVALGKMAAAKGKSQQVKDFGNMMVTDHGKANAELMGIAKGRNFMLPAALDAEHQVKSDSLGKLTGAEFDNAYVRAMIEGHQKTLALMNGEKENGKDAELKAFAAKTAPVVQTHLDKIKKIQSTLK